MHQSQVVLLPPAIAKLGIAAAVPQVMLTLPLPHECSFVTPDLQRTCGSSCSKKQEQEAADHHLVISKSTISVATPSSAFLLGVSRMFLALNLSSCLSRSL